MRYIGVIMMAAVLSLGCTTIRTPEDGTLLGWGKSSVSVTEVTSPEGEVTKTKKAESAGLTENAVAVLGKLFDTIVAIPGAVVRGAGTVLP